MGTQKGKLSVPMLRLLQGMLETTFLAPLKLAPSGGSGNHCTYLLEHRDGIAFARVEDGPEGDGHLALETRVIGEVARTGVPVPGVLFTDASRKRAPFAVQVIEYFDCPDLNSLHREGRLPLEQAAGQIGRNVALWQGVPVLGFGPFDVDETETLRGYHASYAAYFHLHLERHLKVLTEQEFLSNGEAEEIRRLIAEHAGLLEIETGVLVHKDLALWNIMGTPERIRAFIDWDDAIAGDPADDISLMACFHPASVVTATVEGYAGIRALPDNFDGRFWLHLLRNMIVKAVIRCGAGYFEKPAGSAFLMSPGQDGAALRTFTKQRLLAAVRGLREGRPFSDL